MSWWLQSLFCLSRGHPPPPFTLKPKTRDWFFYLLKPYYLFLRPFTSCRHIRFFVFVQAFVHFQAFELMYYIDAKAYILTHLNILNQNVFYNQWQFTMVSTLFFFFLSFLTVLQTCLKSTERIKNSSALFFTQTSDFQPFSSHGTHKLITKIPWHTKKQFFC